MSNELNDHFWESRYQNAETQWDIGDVSTPIKHFIDELSDLTLRILIPGCGNGWEASYLYEKGFKHTYLLDYAASPLANFHLRHPEFPGEQLLQDDFFKHEGQYDLIIEQTFFCAIDPTLRAAYVKQMHRLLKKGGKLAGLLFNCEFEKAGPPFGGNKEEYVNYFQPLFKIERMETAIDSIAPRAGRELFFEMVRVD